MFARNPAFREPKNKEAKIWRFLDFTEFVDLLDRRALFFKRADRFSDPLEGLFPMRNKKLNPEIDGKVAKQSVHRHNLSSARHKVLLNSWHINEYESAAMWQLYSHTSRGIAIQSTFRRLRESFSDCQDDIFVGKVKYIDYRRERLPKGNILSPFLYKRKSFEFENELRAVIHSGSKGRNQLSAGGKYVPVIMNRLIERIVTSPTAPEWFNDLVGSVSQKYSISKKIVVISELKERSVY